MLTIRNFERQDIGRVIEFERELRRQEPNTYYWEPDEANRKRLEDSFADARFCTAVSLLAYQGEAVVGRIDASLISSRCDAACSSAYLDWICVLPSQRHTTVAQSLLAAMREALKSRGVELLIALMASNAEAQRFYSRVAGASIHDSGIWIEI